MKRALLLTFILGFPALSDAQFADKVAAQQMDSTASPDVSRFTGGVTISTQENVQLKADEVEYNQRTGETVLRGSVILRQQLRPASQATPATNLAGEPFPEPKEVTMRMTGGVQIVIGDMTVRAEEADVNGLTGEMVLRGNVRMTRAKKP